MSTDRYHLIAPIRTRGAVEVFLARPKFAFGTARTVAYKRVERDNPRFDTLSARLHDEARVLSALHHPSIVGLLDTIDNEQETAIVIEHGCSATLESLVDELRQRKQGLAFEIAAYFVRELLWALDHAHRATGEDGLPLRVVHRGVEPSNLLLRSSGHIKLTGFAVTRMRDREQEVSMPGVVKGNVAYLPPEYIAGEACDHRVDIYAAGVVLFELCYGRPCFSGANTYEVMNKIVNDGPALRRLAREHVPPELIDIVQQATAFTPEARFESAAEMAHALEQWARLHPCASWSIAAFLDQNGLPGSAAHANSHLRRLGPPTQPVEVDGELDPLIFADVPTHPEVPAQPAAAVPITEDISNVPAASENSKDEPAHTKPPPATAKRRKGSRRARRRRSGRRK